jgi:hypothetical protein
MYRGPVQTATREILKYCRKYSRFENFWHIESFDVYTNFENLEYMNVV